MYKKFYKRLFDVFLSFSLIIFFSPFMIIIFFIIWINIGFPIFKHQRPGLDNKIFTLYKFKTLYDKSKKLSEKKRKNKFGNFLRISGLDELPQLFNILFNNMSFVGPRPLLKKYLKIKKFRSHVRSNCKPGITGLAQIQEFENFKDKRGKSKWINQFTLDREYFYKCSFLLDVKIIFKTFLKFIRFSKKDYYNETKLLEKYLN